MTDRKKQIEAAAYPGDLDDGLDVYVNGKVAGFIEGAEWADKNPVLKIYCENELVVAGKRIEQLQACLDVAMWALKEINKNVDDDGLGGYVTDLVGDALATIAKLRGENV